MVTDNHLEPPLEKVNKEPIFRNPTLRTFLNKSTLRTLTQMEPVPSFSSKKVLTVRFGAYMHDLVSVRREGDVGAAS